MSFDKLKGKMTERHVSQEKLSKVLGITVQSLNAKLNGRSQFTLEEVVKISEHLKLDNPVDIFFNPSVSKMQHIIEPEEEVVMQVDWNRVLKGLKELEGVSYPDWVKIKSGVNDYFRAESTKEANRIQLADPDTIMQFVKNYSSTI